MSDDADKQAWTLWLKTKLNLVDWHLSNEDRDKIVAAVAAALRKKDAEIAKLKGADEQIDKLAKYILAEVPGEPSQSEGAGECAIRIIAKLRAELESMQIEKRSAEADRDYFMKELEAARADFNKYTTVTGPHRYWQDRADAMQAERDYFQKELALAIRKAMIISLRKKVEQAAKWQREAWDLAINPAEMQKAKVTISYAGWEAFKFLAQVKP